MRSPGTHRAKQMFWQYRSVENKDLNVLMQIPEDIRKLNILGYEMFRVFIRKNWKSGTKSAIAIEFSFFVRYLQRYRLEKVKYPLER